jgi:CubicO group peptidase (beta-lactamase class C family)
MRLLLLAALATPALAAQADAPGIDAKALAEVVDPVFASGMKEEQIPGAAFVFVKDGKVVLAKGFGFADVTAKRAVRPDETIFPYASISKVFTATAVMQLVDRGRIELNAPVDKYLKSVRVPATYPQPITVADLLAHTSGLDELPGRRVRTAAEVMPLNRFLADKLVRVHPPGAVTHYSSYGLALAGLMVEEVSGVPFEEYLRREIWVPLGMNRTSITVPPAWSASVATAYELEDSQLVPVPHEIYQTPPTSSIVGTTEDMARFMIAHLEKGGRGRARILSPRTTELMHRQHATMHPQIPGWALGFQADDTNGRRIVEHGGDIGGFSALMTLLPDERAGMFVVHHLEGRDLRFAVRQAVLDRFFPAEHPVQAPSAMSGAKQPLTRFAGKYRASTFCHSCPAGGPNVQDFEIVANEDGTLTLWGSHWVQVGPLYFVRADGRRRLGFAEDSSGRIVGASGGSWRVIDKI